MIKNFSAGFLAFSFSLVITFSLLFNGQLKQEKVAEKRSAADDDLQGYYQWQLNRLADPATGSVPNGMRLKELSFASTLPQTESNILRGSSYVNRGPFNVGGRTRCFAADVNNSSILLAGSVSGGMYRSTDGGQTWNKTVSSIFDEGFTCITQDTRPGYTNIWYAGSGEAYGQSASSGTNGYFEGNGIYKSVDDGITWDTISGTAANSPEGLVSPYQIVWSIKTDPSRTDSSIVYAACYGGIYRSNNAGTTWKRVKGSFGSTDAYYTSLDVSATGKVYAMLSSDGGAYKGIWRSTNGLQYTSIVPDSFPASYNLIVDGINPSNENEIYFLANTVNAGTPDTNYLGTVQWNALWKCTILTDSTSSWQNLSANIPHTGGPFDRFDAQGSYNLVVAIKPDDSNTVIIGGTNIFRSTDGFQTYNNIKQVGGYKIGTHLPVVESYTNHHSDQHVFFFDRTNPNIFYNGNDGGVFKTLNITDDSVTWISLNNGYLTTQLYTIAIDNTASGDSNIVGAGQDNGSWFINSANHQGSWVHPYGGDGAFCIIDSAKSVYYMSEQMGKTERAYVNPNGTVTSFARIDPQNGKGFQFVNPFVLDPNDRNKMYMAAGHYLWRNNNLAGIPMINNYDSITTNWMFFPDTCTSGQGNITAVACSVDSAHILYYGTSTREIFKVRNANVGNPTRQNISSNSFPNGFINCIAVDPEDANKVIVVFSNYSVVSLWYTSNGGTTWTAVAGNLEQHPNGSGNGPSCRWASIMHLTDGTGYFVATSTGLYATDTLNGANTVWVLQGANSVGNNVCDMVLTRPKDGLVVVATHGNGIYSSNVTSVKEIVSSVKNITSSLITEASLFPNPGSNSAELLLNNKQDGFYTINIYNMNGRIINNAVQQLSAGQHSIPLHFPSNEASGVYFVRISSGIESKTLRYLKIN